MLINNIAETIGNTELLKLQSINDEADIYLKMEMNNPTGSVKARAALGMLTAAIENGELKPGMKIVEPTSGNTGIALALLAGQLGYEIDIVMPSHFSVERRQLMKAYGANLILTEADLGMPGAIKHAKEIAMDTKKYYMPSQFDNEYNALQHYNTTAKEIDTDLSDIDCIVAGVGTAGTIVGLARYFKERYPNIKIIAVEPENSPVISENRAGKHKIQGIGAGFIPANYDAQYIDAVLKVSDEQAIAATKDLCKSNGVFGGISTGANYYIARKVAKLIGSGKKVVTIAPDGGEKYLSTGLFEE